MKVFKHSLALGLTLLLQACGNPFSIAANCENGFYTTDSGDRMHWPDGHRIDFEMHKSVPADYRDAISSSSLRYNETFSKSSLHVVESQLQTPSYSGNVGSVTGDNVNGIYWVRDADWAWGESDPYAVAMTVVQFTKKGIKEADIFYKASAFVEKKLKLQSFSLSDTLSTFAYNPSSNNPNRTTHQAYMVSVHEFGHAVGRCHSKSPSSIMYPEVGMGSEETRLNPFSESDLDIFGEVYSIKN